MASTSQLVYLDMCAINRPFDDQEQMRIRMESGAVHLILDHVRTGNLVLAVSNVHILEAAANPDLAKRQHVEYLLQTYGWKISVAPELTKTRAGELFQQGMGVADAAYVAIAEAVESDFVSVDDRLLRQCKRMNTTVWHGTPMAYCEKEGLQ